MLLLDNNLITPFCIYIRYKLIRNKVGYGTKWFSLLLMHDSLDFFPTQIFE